jgi:hypothetical protein
LRNPLKKKLPLKKVPRLKELKPPQEQQLRQKRGNNFIDELHNRVIAGASLEIEKNVFPACLRG